MGILIFQLMLEFLLDINLTIKMDHVVEQLASVSATAYFIAAADYEYLRIRHLCNYEIVEIKEISKLDT